MAAKNEVSKFLKDNFELYKSIMESAHEDIRKQYWQLSDEFKDFSKHLKNRYDGWKHRQRPSMIAQFLVEGLLTRENITNFSEDGMVKLEVMGQKRRTVFDKDL